MSPALEEPGLEQPLGDCTLWIVCGEIRHHEDSAKPYLGITDNWPPEFGNVAYIYRGKSSTDYFKDTDGFLVPSGCVGRSGSLWYGAGWHKIFDFNKLTIRIEC